MFFLLQFVCDLCIFNLELFKFVEVQIENWS